MTDRTPQLQSDPVVDDVGELVDVFVVEVSGFVDVCVSVVDVGVDELVGCDVDVCVFVVDVGVDELVGCDVDVCVFVVDVGVDELGAVMSVSTSVHLSAPSSRPSAR